MSIFSNSRRSSVAALAVTAAVTLASTGVSAFAQTDRDTAKAREYRAKFEAHAVDRCVPVNGAQIMGGFGGADDRIDSVTGEICRR